MMLEWGNSFLLYFFFLSAIFLDGLHLSVERIGNSRIKGEIGFHFPVTGSGVM
jgi:hypothetical protein